MSGCHDNSCSITALIGALCDSSISGLSWKRRINSGGSRECAQRALRSRAYGALLAGLFQDSGSKQPPGPLANTPSHNKVLMMSFDLRTSGREQEAERLEELLGRLRDGGLPEMGSVLELLVQLAGSVAPPPASFARDYMRWERPVLRRAPLAGYLSRDTQRLEERAWSLICREEWGLFGGLCRGLSIMEAAPGSGLQGLGRRVDAEERFEKETRLTLFGALQHSKTTDMDVRLELPPVPSNADLTGLSIRVPVCVDHSDDEGFQSASNLTPDCSPAEPDVWEALRTFVPGRRRCWENIGCPPGQKEAPFLTEAGRDAFDQLYRLWEGEVRGLASTQTPSPLLPLPLPLDCQAQLVKDVLNVLIAVASATFPLNQGSLEFDVRADVCVSGTSPESVSRLLGELARYGTHYLRLSRFSLSGSAQRGLVFQAFTGGLRRYLHYYRACVLSTPASLSLLTIACHFRKLGRQLRYLSELCCVDGVAGAGRNSFPTGVKLLSCLYNEAQSNCSNENHPVLLSLLKSSCEPYTRFVSDWVYSGVFRDVYREFMIEVKEDYLSSRDRSFWTQGYTLISRDVEDCVPVFLRHIANDIYVCGKTINLLKICCPQHYIFRTDVSVPRIAVTFSLQEVQEIERDCAVYRRRMEAIAKHSATSREEQAVRTEQARQELINQVRESTAKTLERIRGQQVSARLQVAAQKRARFQELKQQLESGKDQAEEFSFTRELRDREQRLQALEEQLERRARLDLQAQYSRLSEAAARRELRAVWKLQRMKLDQRRHHFLRQDNQDMQALLETLPMAQRVNRSGSSVVINPAGDPIHSVPDTNRGTDSDCADVREHFSEVLESVPASSLLLSLDGHASLDHSSASVQKSLETQPMGGESTPDVQGPQDTEEACVSHADPSETERVCDADPSLSSALCGHASNAHVRTGEHVSEVATPAVVPNIHGHASDAHIRIGEHVSEVDTPTITPNIHGHASDAHIRIGEHVSEVDTPTITPNIHGHASDAHIRIGEHVSEVATPTITPNIHGHASDAHIRIGEHVSEVATPTITPNIHGHASDAHIRIGEHVSDVDTPTLTPSIHGHASDAHIRIGELVSDVDTPAFTPNIHGHASDAHIRIGEHVSDVTTPTITPNVHGHASDAHMKVGGLMSEVASSRPRCSKYGHASDSTLTAGCVVPAAPSLCALPGDTFRHSSDSTLTVACVDPRPAPLPGSAYGHSSQSSLGVGCVVGGMVLGSSRTSENPEKPADTQAPPAEETLYLSSLCSQYRAEQYQDSYGLSAETPDAELLLQVTRGPDGLPLRPLMSRTPDAGAVQLGEMMPLPVLMKHSVTAPLSTHVSMVNKAAVDYVFVELAVEKHFETLRHFLLMEDGEFALALSNQLFEKLGSGQTPGELLTPLVLNSILNKALQYSVHADSSLAARFTFSLRFLPEIFHPHAPDSLNCLELRYKVDWPLNIVITESCLKKYNRLFSFLLQLKHMVWSLRDVWFHLKRTAAVRGGGRCVQFHQLQLYRHEMQHFVKVIQGYIANQILQVSWSEFIQKLSAASDLDAIHRTHAEYINRAIFRALLTEKAAPVMNIIHSIFSLILKFRGQLIAQSWEVQQGEPVHPGFIAMQQSYNTFQYYSRFLFKVVTKLVDKGYQPHLEDFLLRINLNNYYKDS